MGEFDDLIGEFLVEAFEHLEQLERDLSSLDRNPGDRVALTCIFRSFHTIKGNCGFLGFGQLESVTHAAENLLSILRDQNLAPGPVVVNLILEVTDSVRESLKIIEKDNTDKSYQADALIERLKSAATQLETESQSDMPAFNSKLLAQPPETKSEDDTNSSTDTEITVPKVSSGVFPNPNFPEPAAKSRTPSETLQLGKQTDLEIPVQSLGLDDETIDDSSLSIDQDKHHATQSEPDSPDSKSDSTRDSSITPRPSISSAVAHDTGRLKPNDAEESHYTAVELSVRVDTNLLDEIMNLVGELVLTRNQLQQHVTELGDAKIERLTNRLNVITTQLQDRAMKTRMQPIERLLGKFPRLVRNVSRLCNKAAKLRLEGLDTELDRSLLETIRDPLTHVVRNAIDHGIEAPDERIRLGKPREGLINIKAFHQDGQVHIEVSDDGCGIDPQRIRAKVKDLGLLSEAEVDAMTDSEAISLVFLPGLTTSKEVTRVSGRGVGMDVVKSNIENLGGKVQIATQLGEWTRLTVSIPLTLAIIPSLIVEVQNQDFAIPQVDLVELVRHSSGAESHVETIGTSMFFRLRDQLLPLLDLREELHPGENLNQLTTRTRIAVLRNHDQEFGVIVDGVSEYQEIVVKPLSYILTPLDIFSGSTILDDGAVSLIFDVQGLARRAGLKPKLTSPSAQSVNETVVEETVSMLIFRTGKNWVMSVPLASIGRLEEINKHALQMVDGQLVINYTNQIVPLLPMSDLFSEQDPDATLNREAQRAANDTDQTSGPEPENLGDVGDVGDAGDVRDAGGAIEAADGLEEFDEALDENLVQVIMCQTEDKLLGLIVDEIIDIVDTTLQLQTRAEKQGIYASAIIKNQIVDLVDLNEVVRLARLQLLEKPGAGGLRI